MNAKSRAKFINSVAGQTENNNQAQNLSSEITQAETSKSAVVQNEDIEEEIFAQGLPD